MINSGNNKVIVTYKEKQENALFLINPLDNISKVLLISIKNELSLYKEKNKFYQEFLNKKN